MLGTVFSIIRKIIEKKITEKNNRKKIIEKSFDY